ncbi:signal recognition particle protein [archaeon]|jgi:signal recognition particle subunit SRP54|nr:signal recognition particle protein [archaeon]MBT4396985.1 signal recognition particle protein [archaeon]MBT4440976.1 signal recognition particle protein [archaeon]
MVLEKLGGSLKNTLSKIAKSMFVDERLINELVKDIQRALLQADVNVKLVFELTKQIKERALNEKAPSGVTQKEYLVKIVYEELVKFLGGEKNEIEVNKKPFKIMMVGLFGSGKTTTISKLIKYYANRGHKVCTVGLDVHRPAAPEQLKQLSDSLNVPCFIKKGEKDALKIYKEFEKELEKFDMILVDTAGRDALSEDLVEEIKDLNNYIKPDEKLLVLSADIGQAAQKQAQSFHDSCGVTGVVVTKLDGTAKGGGALSACAVTGAPVKFIGIGEKPEDLEIFNPKGFVGRILGMGDIEALLDKAKEAMDMESAEDLGKKLLKGDFNFLDLYEQMQAMSKMGPLSKVVDMIPGLGGANIPKDMLDGQEGKLKKWKIIMQSCTKEELEDPSLLSRTRIDRIAKGAGVKVSEVRELLKQYKKSKKLMKMMKGSDDPNKLMKKLKGKVPKGF